MVDEIRNLPGASQIKEINTWRAAVIIPTFITVLCTVFDIASKSRIQNVDVFNARLICELLISYFVPTILSTAFVMMWTHYFGIGVSGIKDGRSLHFVVYTGMFFLVYLLYLFYVDTWFLYAFSTMIVVYLYVVRKMCITNKVLKGIGLENDKVVYERSAGKVD